MKAKLAWYLVVGAVILGVATTLLWRLLQYTPVGDAILRFLGRRSGVSNNDPLAPPSTISESLQNTVGEHQQAAKEANAKIEQASTAEVIQMWKDAFRSKS